MTMYVAQISKQYTQYGAALLFFVFGFKMLYEVITAGEKVNHRMLSVLCMPISAGLPCTFHLHACTTTLYYKHVLHMLRVDTLGLPQAML